MTESYSVCCAGTLTEHFETVEGNHGRESSCFSHWTCNECGRICDYSEIVHPKEITRWLFRGLSISERILIASEQWRSRTRRPSV